MIQMAKFDLFDRNTAFKITIPFKGSRKIWEATIWNAFVREYAAYLKGINILYIYCFSVYLVDEKN